MYLVKITRQQDQMMSFYLWNFKKGKIEFCCWRALPCQLPEKYIKADMMASFIDCDGIFRLIDEKELVKFIQINGIYDVSIIYETGVPVGMSKEIEIKGL